MNRAFLTSYSRQVMGVTAFFFCFLLESVSFAAVTVKLQNGNSMTFDTVAIKAGRLECRLSEGVIYLTPDQLAPEEKFRYFKVPMERPAATQPAAPSEPAKPLAIAVPTPANAGALTDTNSTSPDPAPYSAPATISRTPSPMSPVSPLKRAGGFFYAFHEMPKIHRRHPEVHYDYQMDQEKFYLYVPKTYDAKSAYGLVAFIDSRDNVEIPWGWDSILEERKLIFIAPQNVGDSKAESRRVGLTVVGILKMMEEYNIDPSRVYISGRSEGGRMASRLAFQHPELVRGCVPCCGIEFFKSVKWGGSGYGIGNHTPALVETAKRNVRFSIITGETDVHRDAILDIYYGGFVKEAFQAKLFDVPNTPQGVFGANVFDHAIEFVDSGHK